MSVDDYQELEDYIVGDYLIGLLAKLKDFEDKSRKELIQVNCPPWCSSCNRFHYPNTSGHCKIPATVFYDGYEIPSGSIIYSGD